MATKTLSTVAARRIQSELNEWMRNPPGENRTLSEQGVLGVPRGATPLQLLLSPDSQLADKTWALLPKPYTAPPDLYSLGALVLIFTSLPQRAAAWRAQSQ